MSAKPKIQVTKDYRQFTRMQDNRPTNLARHKKLQQSMERYGFLAAFPVVCVRGDKGRLLVKDGQHRLAIAETLGLPVYWVEVEGDFDIALINCTAKTWLPADYAGMYAAKGVAAYQEGIDFATAHGIPLGSAFSLLAGTTTFGNVMPQFLEGKFQVKDRPWAESVVALYGPLVAMEPRLKKIHFLTACMAVCRVAQFDRKRLLENANRSRERVVAYSTREACLEMLEDVYNFGRKQLFALKIAALAVMKDRSLPHGAGE